jgi:quercetin dioxygenase-like cupin family protein
MPSDRSDGDIATAGRTALPSVNASPSEVLAVGFSGWTPELRQEFAANVRNYRVGGRLLSDTDRVKVWEIRLAPGERLPAHRHVLDYFWTAVTAGVTLQHTDDGTTSRVSYKPGDISHLTFGLGEYKLHDIKNVGTAEMIFVTVEYHRAPGDPGPRQV